MAITRLDKNNNPRTVGWWVRVVRERKVYSKLFSDNKYGGNDEAYKLAEEYEQILLNKLPDVITRKEMPNKNNIHGVSKIYITNGSVVTYWYNDDNSKGKASFSISYYGSLALTLAILSYTNQRRIDKCTKTAHKNIQSEYAANFPNLELIRNQFIKD